MLDGDVYQHVGRLMKVRFLSCCYVPFMLCFLPCPVPVPGTTRDESVVSRDRPFHLPTAYGARLSFWYAVWDQHYPIAPNVIKHYLLRCYSRSHV